jgi:hypothetical protein
LSWLVGGCLHASYWVGARILHKPIIWHGVHVLDHIHLLDTFAISSISKSSFQTWFIVQIFAKILSVIGAFGVAVVVGGGGVVVLALGS